MPDPKSLYGADPVDNIYGETQIAGVFVVCSRRRRARTNRVESLPEDDAWSPVHCADNQNGETGIRVY